MLCYKLNTWEHAATHAVSVASCLVVFNFIIWKVLLNDVVLNTQSSESVTLDLLTYSDLELLRNRKVGVVGRPRAQQQSPALSAKRYLILIYTVEFDRSVPFKRTLQ